MSLRDDFQPKWKLALKWGWLSFAVFILMSPTFYTVYISFNELGFGAKYYIFTFQWYESVFSDRQLIGSLGWTMLLAFITLPIVIPFGLMSAKLYKQSTKKVWIVFILLSPLFVPADILGSALLVFFKNLNKFFTMIAEYTGIYALETWFDLGIMTAVIGLIVYTLPYVFVVIMPNSRRTLATYDCSISYLQWHQVLVVVLHSTKSMYCGFMMDELKPWIIHKVLICRIHYSLCQCEYNIRTWILVMARYQHIFFHFFPICCYCFCYFEKGLCFLAFSEIH